MSTSVHDAKSKSAADPPLSPVGVGIVCWESDDIVSPERGAFHAGKKPVSAGSGWRVKIKERWSWPAGVERVKSPPGLSW